MTTNREAWMLCLWPGLARAWLKGDWVSLALAFVFTALLNLALITTFRWPEWLGAGFSAVLWPILSGIWVVSFLLSLREMFPRNDSNGRPEAASAMADTLFIQAQREYLNGNWLETERLLTSRLRFQPRDVESRLLLATLFRRQNRFDEALEELSILSGFDESTEWMYELSCERKLNLDLQSDSITKGLAQELPQLATIIAEQNGRKGQSTEIARGTSADSKNEKNTFDKQLSNRQVA